MTPKEASETLRKHADKMRAFLAQSGHVPGEWTRDLVDTLTALDMGADVLECLLEPEDAADVAATNRASDLPKENS